MEHKAGEKDHIWFRRDEGNADIWWMAMVRWKHYPDKGILRTTTFHRLTEASLQRALRIAQTKMYFYPPNAYYFY